jgi:ribosomal protein S18 acetylase RimI-like enzyme
LIGRTARSLTAHSHVNDAISHRIARPDEEPFLLRVYASTREEELRATGWDDAQKAAFIQLQFRAQISHYRQSFADSDYEVILLGTEPIGRMYIHRDAHEIRVVDIGLLREYRNQGIGGALMKAVQDEAARARKPVRLHVETYNPAMRFYERLGFTKINEHGIHVEMEWSASADDHPAGS